MKNSKNKITHLFGTMLAFAALLLPACAGAPGTTAERNLQVDVSIAETLAPSVTGVEDGLNGRLLLMVSRSGDTEPRFQVSARLGAIPVYGQEVQGFSLGESVSFDGSVFGFPVESLNQLEAGDYVVQALFHRYETFELSNGKTIQLPMDRGEGQQWRRAPGNLYSTPETVTLDDARTQSLSIALDQIIPAIEKPADSEYVKHIEIKSDRLSDFWGRDMMLGAHVLLPHGFDQNPNARYPLMVFHGHFPSDFGGFRTTPPDPDLECEYSDRFHLDCYNKIQQQEAHDFYQQWISDDFPRFIAIEIQHQNPYYDDSYAVNSANLGPYGDALIYELIPHIEEQFRGVGEGWGRFTYGGSTGGWEALAVQVLYPDEYNGAFAACPDPIDFRAFTSVNIYEDENAYYHDSDFKQSLRPGWRNYLGDVQATVRDMNLMELALGGEDSKSGDQFDIWQAVYSPMDEDGYPKPIWDRRTGVIDRSVAEYWRENYDLRYIMERDWATIGPKLVGKVHIFCGDMDNYYLNNAVYLTEDFLESTTDPYYAGEVDYGDRAEHCWNGDQENGNHISRLRYNTMYLPRIKKRLRATAPPNSGLVNW